MDSSRPLRDAPDRSYVDKLELFARFAEPELRRVFADLELPAGATVLDVGCGAGLTTGWLRDAASGALAVGVDLSLPHLRHASRHAPVVQGDLARLCFRDGVFDLIWCCNTIHHVGDPVAAVVRLRAALRRGGRMVLAQSGFVPEMFFAWDAPLDEAVRGACHRAYRERYELSDADTAGVRGLVRLMRAAGFARPEVRTRVIERTQPLAHSDRDYLQRAVFDGSWGARVAPYLGAAERARLQRNCDPASPEYCLDRDDFHHLQTLTVCVGRA
jgi:SAM-dependent methyltransferase